MYRVFGSWLFDVVTKIPSPSCLCTFFYIPTCVCRQSRYCNCFVCLCIPNISGTLKKLTPHFKLYKDKKKDKKKLL